MAAAVDETRIQFGSLPVKRPFYPSKHLEHKLSPKTCTVKEDESSEFQDLIRKGKSELEPSILDPRDDGTADNGIMRNPSLVRLTGKHPFNSEPPLDRLMHHGFITPTPLHYVRNHGGVPKADWDNWIVEVSGLVKNPVGFSMSQLVTEFRSVEFPVTIMCSANRRKEQNMVKQTLGFNWGAAATSTSLWRGVPLRDVLKRCEIFGRSKGALYVWFEGAEDLPGGGGSKYGTSIRRDLAMDPARDIILAYRQNGEFLPPDHGFPVRMIVPGFTGGRMVKWLKRIIVTNKESDNYYHFMDNRLLPSHVDSELANAQGWWYKPEYAIYEMNINSVITTPCHDEMLAINRHTTQTPFTLRGFAYSGGGKKVTSVQVTMDEGKTWQLCKLKHHEKPNKYGKYWCWCFWSLEVEAVDLIGAKEIAVRAWDETNNTQPEKLNWNLMGMMNNSWFRVKIDICKSPKKGEIGIVFRHPTLPGNQSGGWLEKQKDKEKEKHLAEKSPEAVKNSISRKYSISEVQTHNTPESAWIVVHGQVYDCTPFLKAHPGGADSILINAGTDCTEEFDAIHSDKAKNMLQDYKIGDLIAVQNPTSSDSKIPVKLISKTSISRDTRVFRFALPSEDQTLGLPVGKHIFLCATIDGNLCMRAYTPSSSNDEAGYFDLVIKIYFKNVHPKFPDGGLMSQYLDSLPMGSVVEVKGPLGHIEYKGKGDFTVHRKPISAKKLAMIAGGTGITPIYQVVQAIMRNPEDETEMFLVYANRTEGDILLREELEAWAEKNKRLKIWYVVKESGGEGWPYSVGFITESMLREHIPAASDDTLALVCGPPPMIEFAVKPMLEKLKYDTVNRLLVF